jgi:hypothetical protein
MSVPALVAANSFLVPIPRLSAGTIGRATLHPRLPDKSDAQMRIPLDALNGFLDTSDRFLRRNFVWRIFP